MQLLLLFNADALELDPDMRREVQQIQDHVLLALEEHCSSQDSKNSQRFGKLLVMIATLKSITHDALHRSELSRSLEAASITENLIDSLII